MSMYAAFNTDKNGEVDGIWFNYGSFKIKGARLGGANRAAAIALESALRPFQRVLQAQQSRKDDTEIDPVIDKQIEKLTRGVIATHCVKDWAVWDDGEEDWIEGKIENPDSGKLEAFRFKTAERVFELYPDLFRDFSEQIKTHETFVSEAAGAIAGN